MGGNYSVVEGNAADIGANVEAFNDSSVTSIDDFDITHQGNNRVLVLVEWQ